MGFFSPLRRTLNVAHALTIFLWLVLYLEATDL